MEHLSSTHPQNQHPSYDRYAEMAHFVDHTLYIARFITYGWRTISKHQNKSKINVVIITMELWI